MYNKKYFKKNMLTALMSVVIAAGFSSGDVVVPLRAKSRLKQRPKRQLRLRPK